MNWKKIRVYQLIAILIIEGGGTVVAAVTNDNPLVYSMLYSTAQVSGRSSPTLYLSFCSAHAETALTNATVTLEHGGRKDQLRLFWMTPQCLGAKFRFVRLGFQGEGAPNTNEIMRLVLKQGKFTESKSFTQLQEKVEFYVVNDGSITHPPPISPEVRLQLIMSVVNMRQRDKLDNGFTPNLQARINKSAEEIENRDVKNVASPLFRQTMKKKLWSAEAMNGGGDPSNQFALAVSNRRHGKFNAATAEFNSFLTNSYTPAIKWLSAYYLIDMAYEQSKKTENMQSRKDLAVKAMQTAEILQKTWPGIDGIPEVLGNIGILAFQASETEQALEAFRMAEQNGLDYSDAANCIYQYTYAYTLEKVGRNNEAMSRYKKLVWDTMGMYAVEARKRMKALSIGKESPE